MECFDVYDKDRNLTGKKIFRGENSSLSDGEYHLVVDLILVNTKGEFLIQKRVASKSYCPNMWGLTGGSVLAGENSLQGIVRETDEEIGLKLQAEDLTLFHKAYGVDQPILVDVWSACKDIKISELKMQKEEVCELKWVNTDELRCIFKEKQFMPTLVPFLEKYIAENGC